MKCPRLDIWKLFLKEKVVLKVVGNEDFLKLLFLIWEEDESHTTFEEVKLIYTWKAYPSDSAWYMTVIFPR